MGYAPFNIRCDYGLVYIVARYMIVSCYLPIFLSWFDYHPRSPLVLWIAIVSYIIHMFGEWPLYGFCCFVRCENTWDG